MHTNPIATLPSSPVRTLGDLTRELTSQAPSATRATAAIGLTAYPSDEVALACLLRAEHDPDRLVSATARAAMNAIFSARPDLVVAASAEDDGEGSPRYFARLERFVARLPMPVALEALFHASGRAKPEEWRRRCSTPLPRPLGFPRRRC